MNVTQLQSHLAQLIDAGHGDMLVVTSHDSNDYWRTWVAEQISTVEIGTVKYSSYHNQLKIVIRVDPDEDDPLVEQSLGQDPSQHQAVILV